MNAQSFVDNFGHLASAPDGVKRLRDLVSYFAITGGLSTHHAGDSDVTTLASETLQAKQQYLEMSSTRRSKRKNAELRQTVAQIPERWILLPAGDLVDLINGRAFKASDWKTSGLPIIRIQNLNNPKAPYNHYQGEVSDGHRVEHGDMLLSWSGTPGTSFGAFIWGGGEAVLNQHIFKVIIFSSRFAKEYLRIAINACLDALIGSARGGVGLKHVTKGQIEALQIPCPPLEEQKRIVAKVDELMALCDKLETQQQERERRFPILSSSTHDRFSRSPSLKNLFAIFDSVGTVDPQHLRKTVLSAAIQGLLVPQTSAPNHKAIEEIIKERVNAPKELRLKKPLPPAAEFASNLKIPDSWSLVSPDQIAAIRKNSLTIGPFGSSLLKSDYRTSGVPLVFVRDIRSECFGGPDTRFISSQKAKELESHMVRTGDLLVTKMGDPPGDTTIYPAERPDAVITADCIKLTAHKKVASAEFLRHVLRAPEIAKQFVFQTRGVAHKKVSLARFRVIAVPLPPLAEQREIVSRIDQLMEMIDLVEKQQAEANQLGRLYARSVVESITGIESTKPATMKTRKNELISNLKIAKKPKLADKAKLATILQKQKGELSTKALWQQSGLEIDDFYQQLRNEIAAGWIAEPVKEDPEKKGSYISDAYMKEITK